MNFVNHKKVNILFISSLLKGSGNYTSSNRLFNYLKDTFLHEDNIITLYDNATDLNDNSNKEILDKKLLECDIVILLHAFRSGKLLPNDFVKPIFLILGGTDINNDLNDNIKLEIIKNTINKSCVIYSFNKIMVDIINNQINNGIISIKEDTKVILMPQAVLLPESNSNNIYSLKKSYNIPFDSKLILLPAGIRKVKDPLYLINEIYRWHQEDTQIYFAIVGPIIETILYDEMILLINSFGNLENSGIIYCNQIEHFQLIDAMKESDLIINSSLSEGMCGSLLEAMSCNIPVLARNIPGNSNIITHLHNGLLFNDGKEFVELAKELFKSNELKEKLINNAYNSVQERHSKDIERQLFVKPIIECLS